LPITPKFAPLIYLLAISIFEISTIAEAISFSLPNNKMQSSLLFAKKDLISKQAGKELFRQSEIKMIGRGKSFSILTKCCSAPPVSTKIAQNMRN